MTFLILGSNSFSGSSFIDYLLLKKHNVIGVSRSRELNKIYLKYKNNKEIKKFKFFKININNNLNKFNKVIQKYKPKIILNFAAQSMVAESWKNPEDWYNTNIVSSAKLITILSKYNFIKKFINFTTPEVYGSTKNWIKENFHFNPTTPYAISRACFDQHLLATYKTFKFPVVFVRTANVYGPGQQLYRIIPKTIINIIKKKKISLHGGGKSIRSFIHIDDVSSALYLICKYGKIGNTYHISGKSMISIFNLVKLICVKLKKDYKKYIVFSKERPGKDMAYKLKSSTIRRSFKWYDQISLEAGITSVKKWIDTNFSKLRKASTLYEHKK